jgi:hypothetical protein
MMNVLTGLLDNLVLAATSNKTMVQQLLVANLALTTSVATLTATSKKLIKKVARCNHVPHGCGTGGGPGGDSVRRDCPKVIWGNYCWMHEYKVMHTSKTYNASGRKPGHDELATVVDMKGGADTN